MKVKPDIIKAETASWAILTMTVFLLCQIPTYNVELILIVLNYIITLLQYYTDTYTSVRPYVNSVCKHHF